MISLLKDSRLSAEKSVCEKDKNNSWIQNTLEGKREDKKKDDAKNERRNKRKSTRKEKEKVFLAVSFLCISLLRIFVSSSSCLLEMQEVFVFV
jgi:hypothetical protein